MLKRTLAALIIAVALAACSTSAAPPSPTSTNPTATEPVAQEPTAAPSQATDTPAATEPAAEVAEPPTPMEPAAEEAPAETAGETGPQPEEVLANTRLNLNEATGEDFQAAIPNFGNRMVREFLEYRPYISIQQFRREIGKYVDEAQVADYEQYVYVPVKVDEADAETLKQIPGIDDTIAAELIAARPYGSNEAFLAKLADYLSEAELAVAGSYLAGQ